MTIGYLQEVTGDLDGPPCHVCGAIMVRVDEPTHKWECLSCGATTGCTEVKRER